MRTGGWCVARVAVDALSVGLSASVDSAETPKVQENDGQKGEGSMDNGYWEINNMKKQNHNINISSAWRRESVIEGTQLSCSSM